jgi:hypothetical protein
MVSRVTSLELVVSSVSLTMERANTLERLRSVKVLNSGIPEVFIRVGQDRDGGAKSQPLTDSPRHESSRLYWWNG